MVTGVAGFIGSHMAEGLMKKGYAVTGLDNMSTGEKRNIPKGIKFFKGDVTNPRDLGKAFASAKIAGVFHIAGCASTIKAFDDPEADLRTNTFGTVRVVQACLENKVPRLLYASSMTAYGHPSKLPVSVDSSCRPISYYGISKYAAERYALATGERKDLSHKFGATAFRMFNVYGRRQSLTNPYQGVASIFIGNVLRGEPVKIFGDGQQSRDFIHISDVVAAWIKAFTSPKAVGQVFNLGSGTRISVNRLVDTDIRAFGLNPKNYAKEYYPVRPGDQRHMQADISKTKKILNWKPRMSFEKGMGDVIQWALEEARSQQA
jgi:UDP-glucose 4-epimerase